MSDVAATAAECRVPSHILLNLPADSTRFLAPLRALRAVGRGTDGQCGAPPIVHCYSFTAETDAAGQAREGERRVAGAMGAPPQAGALRVCTVRRVAPAKAMVCYEFPLW